MATDLLSDEIGGNTDLETPMSSPDIVPDVENAESIEKNDEAYAAAADGGGAAAPPSLGGRLSDIYAAATGVARLHCPHTMQPTLEGVQSLRVVASTPSAAGSRRRLPAAPTTRSAAARATSACAAVLTVAGYPRR